MRRTKFPAANAGSAVHRANPFPGRHGCEAPPSLTPQNLQRTFPAAWLRELRRGYRGSGNRRRWKRDAGNVSRWKLTRPAGPSRVLFAHGSPRNDCRSCRNPPVLPSSSRPFTHGKPILLNGIRTGAAADDIVGRRWMRTSCWEAATPDHEMGASGAPNFQRLQGICTRPTSAANSGIGAEGPLARGKEVSWIT